MTAATKRDSTRNPRLDVCRSSAILLVVLGRGIEYLEPLFPNTVQLFKFTGFIGVELFFVLSGFLIGQMLMRYADEDLPKWLQTFYMRRMIRTLPNYGLFLVVNVTLAYMMIRPSGLSELWKYGLFVQNAMTPHPERVFYRLRDRYFPCRVQKNDPAFSWPRREPMPLLVSPDEWTEVRDDVFRMLASYNLRHLYSERRLLLPAHLT